MSSRGLPAEAAPNDGAFYDDLDGSLVEAWRLLEEGAIDRHSPCHTPSLGTLDADGLPTVRTVVLRAVERKARLLRFHTDLRSHKVAEIAAQPMVALHAYHPGRKIQLRLAGQALVHRDDKVAREAWQASRSFSRLCYGVEPGPGVAIEASSDWRQGEDGSAEAESFRNFGAVLVTVQSLEWLYLAARGHRRALYDWRSGSLSKTWLVP